MVIINSSFNVYIFVIYLIYSQKKLFELEKKIERRKLREEKRKAIRLKRLADQEADEMNKRIVTEERLLLKTQRKLEAIHLLGELFTRIKVFNIQNYFILLVIINFVLLFISVKHHLWEYCK